MPLLFVCTGRNGFVSFLDGVYFSAWGLVSDALFFYVSLELSFGPFFAFSLGRAFAFLQLLPFVFVWSYASDMVFVVALFYEIAICVLVFVLVPLCSLLNKIDSKQPFLIIGCLLNSALAMSSFLLTMNVSFFFSEPESVPIMIVFLHSFFRYSEIFF